jgi:hypothetical protein
MEVMHVEVENKIREPGNAVIKCGYCGNSFKTSFYNKKYCDYTCQGKYNTLRESIRNDIRKIYLIGHKEEIEKTAEKRMKKELKVIQNANSH